MTARILHWPVLQQQMAQLSAEEQRLSRVVQSAQTSPEQVEQVLAQLQQAVKEARLLAVLQERAEARRGSAE